MSTVRWASVGKKAERGVEGTEGQRGGLQSLHRDNTHMRVIGEKQKTWAVLQSKSKRLMYEQFRGYQANQAQRFDIVG